MIVKNLKKLFDQVLDRSEPEPEDRDHVLKVSTAALLVEMAGADYGDVHLELSLIESLLRDQFDLTRDETEALVQAARQQSEEAVSLHEFTRKLHEHLSHEERLAVIELLWRVAYADEELHRYEDNLVRKVSDLLYVRHSDFVRLKHKVLDSR